jgi:hypothetical protein
VKSRQPINASMARRIGSGSIGQASMTLTKFGSVVSISVSAGSPNAGFPDRFSESEQVRNLLHGLCRVDPLSAPPSRMRSHEVNLTGGYVTRQFGRRAIPSAGPQCLPRSHRSR